MYFKFHIDLVGERLDPTHKLQVLQHLRDTINSIEQEGLPYFTELLFSDTGQDFSGFYQYKQVESNK